MKWKALYSSRNVRRRHTTQSLWFSETPENYSDLVHSLQDCVKDNGLWMEENKLKLNNVKTKAIRFSSSSSINTTLPYPQTISLSNTNAEFSGTICNLDFIFDSNLSMKQHIIKTCKAAYTEIRCLSSIHQYLTEDTTKTLVNSCILSRLDCCNSLLAGYPQTVIKPLQQVQNSAAKLILKFHRAEHAKPLLKQLHWLPIEQRIKYKIACFCYWIITGTAHSTWLDLPRSTSLLGLCALLWMIESFASPSSKENSMVVVPFASLLSKSGILFLSLSVTALPFRPSKLA